MLASFFSWVSKKAQKCMGDSLTRSEHNCVIRKEFESLSPTQHVGRLGSSNANLARPRFQNSNGSAGLTLVLKGDVDLHDRYYDLKRGRSDGRVDPTIQLIPLVCRRQF